MGPAARHKHTALLQHGTLTQHCLKLAFIGCVNLAFIGKLLTPVGWSDNMMRSECDSFAITLNCEGLKEQCSCFGQGASLHTARGK